MQAVKGGRNALSTTWRGGYSGICAVMKLTAHMVALQERMAGPRYDCYGPWAMCPADIVAQFLRECFLDRRATLLICKTI